MSGRCKDTELLPLLALFSSKLLPPSLALAAFSLGAGALLPSSSSSRGLQSFLLLDRGGSSAVVAKSAQLLLLKKKKE